MAYFDFARKISKNETIRIFDYGNTMRDYTYVDDVVNGIVSTMYTSFNSTEILNIGNNNPVKIGTFVKTLELHMRRKAQIEYTTSAKGDVPVTFANIEKARCMIGYNPITDIHEGIANFVRWFEIYERDLNNF